MSTYDRKVKDGEVHWAPVKGQTQYTEAMLEIPATSTLERALGSDSRITRNKAIKAVGKYLAAQKKLQKPGVLKLWKALFASMWNCDLLIPQHKLGDKIVALAENLTFRNAQVFVQCGWETLAREWGIVGKHRMDKYMMLSRKLFQMSLKRVVGNNYDHGEMKIAFDSLDIVFSLTFTGSDSLCLHVLSMYLTEIARTEKTWSSLAMQKVVQKMMDLHQTTKSESVRLQMEEHIWAPLLRIEAGETELLDPEFGIQEDKMGWFKEGDFVSSGLFSMASDPKTPEFSRGRMYRLMRRWKDAKGEEEEGPKGAEPSSKRTLTLKDAAELGETFVSVEDVEPHFRAMENESTAGEEEDDDEDDSEVELVAAMEKGMTSEEEEPVVEEKVKPVVARKRKKKETTASAPATPVKEATAAPTPKSNRKRKKKEATASAPATPVKEATAAPTPKSKSKRKRKRKTSA